MRIHHRKPEFTGVEVHHARALDFVDGVAEAPYDAAFAAKMYAAGYAVVDEPVKPKRRRKQPDIELTEDVALAEKAAPEIGDDVPVTEEPAEL